MRAETQLGGKFTGSPASTDLGIWLGDEAYSWAE